MRATRFWVETFLIPLAAGWAAAAAGRERRVWRGALGGHQQLHEFAMSSVNCSIAKNV